MTNEVANFFRGTLLDFPGCPCVHQLFEAQAQRTPEAIAVVHGASRRTYRELDQKADQLAARLKASGVGSDVLVGLCADRSIESVTALLAILKAGGAYVPLDPAYPAERLAFMIEDAGVVVLLTQSHLLGRLPATRIEKICLDTWNQSAAQAASELHARPTSPTNLDSLAYVIYTSGSTGRPKGVAMPHRALVNLLNWHADTLPVTPGERTLQFTSLSFDVSFQEIFSTWCGGGTLVLMNEGLRRDPGSLWQYLREQEITRLFLPFVALQQLAEAADLSAEVPTSLREVITAGEQLRITPAILALFRRLPAARLHNHYGPTETHVVTSYTLPEDRNIWPVLPPIGRPIANCQAFLLNEHCQPVPAGEVGELYLGGACLARGYLNRPDLTNQKFIRDSFSPEAQARLYRTGDLARRNPDGDLEFIGRTDDQVKIRGFRVELGEIEALLSEHPAVRECVVQAWDFAGERRLVAYVVPRPGQPDLRSALRSYLRTRVADFMVPAHYVLLDHLPLTPSGKVNRRGLPKPDLSREISGVEFVAPKSQTEEIIASAWRAVLGLAKVGTADNFFDLGGSSLKLVEVQRRLEQALGREVPITTLFQYPTVATLAIHLDGGAEARWIPRSDVRQRVVRQRHATARMRAPSAGR